jgi:hypothetical protein
LGGEGKIPPRNPDQGGFLRVRRPRFRWGCELIEQASQSGIGCFLVRKGGKSPFLPPARPGARRRHVDRLIPAQNTCGSGQIADFRKASLKLSQQRAVNSLAFVMRHSPALQFGLLPSTFLRALRPQALGMKSRCRFLAAALNPIAAGATAPAPSR